MTLRSIAFVVALCASGLIPARADTCDPFAVGIRLRVDPSVASRRIAQRVKDEADSIWRPVGIHLEWTDAGVSAPVGASLSFDAIIERRLEAPERPGSPTVLGSAVVTPDSSNGQPIRVSVEATENVLAGDAASRTSTGIVPERALARALGRVLAHEIGHVLLAAPYHDQAGLMRAAFRPDELARPDRAPFRLTRNGIARLRSRLRVLAGDPRLVDRPDSTGLDLEGVRETRRQTFGDASCAAIRLAR